MNRTFSLIPFPPGAQAGIEITGAIERRSNSLSLSYALSGPLSDIVIPPSAKIPERAARLWEDTCMEFFIGPKNSESYWEFNLSPAGHWNVYRFTSYRAGMREEPAYGLLPFVVEKKSDALRLSLELSLDGVIPTDQDLNAGITAIIKKLNGGIIYWALAHPGAEADFHRRDSFILEL